MTTITIACVSLDRADHANFASPVFCFEKSQGEEKLAEYYDIAEVVFRYEIAHVKLRSLPQLYFLSLGDNKDPSRDFMQRFEDGSANAKAYSESRYQDGRVTDRQKGQRGIRLEVKCIKHVSRDEVSVEGSWFNEHEDYQEQVFTVIKDNGKWSVKDVKNLIDT